VTTIPREVLSDHFQERMQGRRIVSALFTTFRFEPAFFETQILPAFFDSALSQADAIRLVQLEVSLRELKGSIAVYYDRNGLVADGGSSKLDVRRIAVSHSTGIFHPKNVFASSKRWSPMKRDTMPGHCSAPACRQTSPAPAGGRTSRWRTSRRSPRPGTRTSATR